MSALPYTIEAHVLGLKRQISTEAGDAIIPDVTIEEMHTDEVVVTKHPVDFGAQISDHAYKNPAQVICTFGWSDSSRLINSLISGSILQGVTNVRDVYDRFLELMKKREVLTLSTGKRSYDAVIITKISTRTTADTESALILNVTFTEIIRVAAQVVSLSQAKNPSKYSGTKNRGNVGYNATAVGTGG